MIFRTRSKLALESDASADIVVVSLDDAVALAEAAEAAEVEARATTARARAVRLRQQAEPGGVALCDDTAQVPADSDVSDSMARAATVGKRRSLRRPTSTVMLIAAVAVVVSSSLAASGYFVWHHHVASQKRLTAVDFVAAGRQDVTALMSLDFNKTDENMRRISDNSTGTFKQHFPVIAQQLSQGLQRSKVTTTVTVSDVAVESMTANSAVVLVAATTQAKEADGAPEPRTWHIALTLQRDGGQPKMSNVEFVQ